MKTSPAKPAKSAQKAKTVRGKTGTLPVKHTDNKKKYLWWVLGIGGAVAAFFLLNSFKAGKTVTPEGCRADRQCLIAFWKWKIAKTPDWVKEEQRKATEWGITYEQVLDKDAAWLIDNKTEIKEADLNEYLATR